MTGPHDSMLSHVHALEDLRWAAAERLPQAVLDYVDGGSDDELTLTANEAAWREPALRPRTLVDTSAASTVTTVAGQRFAAPIGLAPTGYTRLLDPAGELAVARAAAAAGLPYALSTVASTSLEDVTAAGTAPWFQLYALKDRGRTRDLVQRARAAGCPVLLLTVDTQAPGNRLRDLRSDFAFPAGLGAVEVGGSSPGETGVLFADALTWDDLARIREWWGDAPLLLKGPVSPADAVRAVAEGASGVHVSNHGGRQLDRTVATARLLPEVRRAIPEATVTVDGGIRTGIDVAVALALGADAVFVGRPYLWGLAAYGEPGVSRALALLHEGLVRTMRLLGVTSVADLRAAGSALLA